MPAQNRGDARVGLTEILAHALDREHALEMRACLGGTVELEQHGGPRPSADEWVCEQHPDQPWPHDGCDGPGMPARDA